MDDFSTFPVMVHQKHKSIIFLAQLYIMARLLWQITLKQIIIQNLIRIVKSGNWKHYWSKWTFASYWQQANTLLPDVLLAILVLILQIWICSEKTCFEDSWKYFLCKNWFILPVEWLVKFPHFLSYAMVEYYKRYRVTR